MRVLTIFITLFLISLLPLTNSYSQELREDFWVTDREVIATALDEENDRLYIGGNFSYVGPSTGGAVPVDWSTGKPISSFPKVDGTVYDILEDNNGGWYIGGVFTHVGSYERENIARINSDMTVDESWNPGTYAPWTSGAVRSMILHNDILYIGGSFSTIGGKDRSGLAAVNTLDGAITDWDPNLAGSVNTLGIYVDSDNSESPIIYAGGTIRRDGSSERDGLAAIDGVSGNVLNWTPSIGPETMSPRVNKLLVTEEWVYLTGHFLQINGVSRTKIGAVDRVTGEVTAWNLGLPVAGLYHDMVIVDSTLYLNRRIHDGEVSRLGAFDRFNGEHLHIYPEIDATPRSVYYHNESLYIGGDFTMVDGEPRRHIAEIDLGTRTVTDWNPSADDNYVLTFTASDSFIYIGGRMNSVGGETRNRFAEIDITTGHLTDWSVPEIDNTVNDITLSSSFVFIGGEFDNVGDQPRSKLAAFDRTNRELVEWSTEVTNPATNDRIYSLDYSNSTLYIGGRFSEFSGEERSNLAGINAENGELLDWAPSASQSVFALRAHNNSVFLGGAFRSIGDSSRARIAEVDAETGELSDWDPGSGQRITSFYNDDEYLYVGGNFTYIADEERNYLVSFDLENGNLTDWTPPVDGRVFTISGLGNVIYAGGDFESDNESESNHIVALHKHQSEVITDWNPAADERVNSIEILEESGLIITAGAFNIIAGDRNRKGLAFLSAFDDFEIPQLVEMLYPEDEAIVESDQVEFTWNEAGDDIIEYNLQLSADTEFNSLVNDKTVSDTTITISGIEDNEYWWRVRARNQAGWGEFSEPFSFSFMLTGTELLTGIPDTYELSQNYPNPFNPATIIEFALPEAVEVQLSVYDILGRHLTTLVDDLLQAGYHEVTFDAGHLASGVYIYRILAGEFEKTRQLTLIK